MNLSQVDVPRGVGTGPEDRFAAPGDSTCVSVAMGRMPSDNASSSRVDVALAELRKAIQQRQLVPGEPLRLEALSQRMNMSVQPIREAIRLLEAEGLIERANNRGSVVAKVPLPDIIDLCAMRTSIEPMMVSMATQRASDDEIAAIRQAHDRLASLVLEVNSTQDLSQMSVDWHLMIYSAARSRHLNTFIERAWTAIRINSAWTTPVEMDLIDDHEAIIVAMEQRDYRAAADAMRRHVHASVHEHIEGFIGESDTSVAKAVVSYQQLLIDLGIVAQPTSSQPI